MGKFKKIKLEFEKFLRSLDVSQLSATERKLINIIRNHFDEIAEYGRAGGRRAKLLNKLIQEHGRKITDELILAKEEIFDSGFPIKKLNSIEIENFRGFTSKEIFKFDRPYTLIYGPNGTGKSSFCEALEFSMLGYINEADSRRIDIIKYITNTTTKTYTHPKLLALGPNEAEIEVVSSPTNYHFSFIEKNRIEGFARISSNTPANQNEMIATLFGLDEFNNFVEDFTENFEKYIDAEGIKAAELNQKKQELEKYQQNIKDFKSKLKDIEEEKKGIVKESKLDKTFDELDMLLYGSKDKENGNKGKIAEIDTELSKPLSNKITFKSTELLAKEVSEVQGLVEEYEQLNKEYENQKSQIDFRKLYNLVINLEKVSKNKCPVCETPIEKATVHPFKNARDKLKGLKKIAELEESKEKTWTTITKKVVPFIVDIEEKNELAEKLSSELIFQIPERLKEKIFSESSQILNEIKKLLTNFLDNKKSSFALDILAEKENKKITELTSKRAELADQKVFLQDISTNIIKLKERERTYKDAIDEAWKHVEEFYKVNEELIEIVDKEKEQINLNLEFLATYQSLISKLKEYKKLLPLSLVKNLNELTTDFYNAINCNDQTFELLDKIELPSQPKDYIKIYFKDDPDEEYDALQILSEGHIRCLGLSMLLAKNVYEGNAIIIFDDVVNAIDDDHRGGIRELLFQNPRLKKKQIILTSHAEEFIKDLDNQFSAKEYKQVIGRINFLSPSEERRIRVNFEQPTLNYLEKAKVALSKDEKRECLRNCRTALENITATLWKKLDKKYNTQIAVKLRTLSGPPDLMSIVNGLRKFLEKTVNDLKFKRIIDILCYISGLEKTHHTIWNYLNKGTHEESEKKEFDKGIVQQLLNELINLDSEVKGHSF